jgi:hypothetical protein
MAKSSSKGHPRPLFDHIDIHLDMQRAVEILTTPVEQTG